LATHFLDKLSSIAGHPAPIVLKEDALNALSNHEWHGNVRELENVINRLFVIATTPAITYDDVENVLGNIIRNFEIIQSQSKKVLEAARPLRPNRAELCEDETITAYMRRVKLDLLTAAIAQYPNRTAAAQRLGLTKDALKRQLRYLRNTTARSAAISANGQEAL
jgi:two-component system nitrogen regulation response regulator GlnG